MQFYCRYVTQDFILWNQYPNHVKYVTSVNTFLHSASNDSYRNPIWTELPIWQLYQTSKYTKYLLRFTKDVLTKTPKLYGRLLYTNETVW